MDINKILAEYDAMFGSYELEEIEAFLQNNIKNAIDTGDYGSMITLLNEIIGFCRDTTQKEKALNYCESLLNVMDQLDLQGRVDYATSLLNIANAIVHLVFGRNLLHFMKRLRVFIQRI